MKAVPRVKIIILIINCSKLSSPAGSKLTYYFDPKRFELLLEFIVSCLWGFTEKRKRPHGGSLKFVMRFAS